MTRSLPPNPNLIQLRKRAKELLKAYKAGDAFCLDVLQCLPGLKDRPSIPVVGIQLSLADAQFALARAYGFANWAELKAQLAPQPALENVSDHNEPFFEASAVQRPQVHRDGQRTWIEPIPNFPLKARRLDADGKQIDQKVGPREVTHALAYAMRMLGHDMPFHMVAAAAGRAFYFNFSESWSPDAQRISPIDCLAQACQTLGFDCQLLHDRPIEETCQAINNAIERGVPALVGTDPIYWRLVVGRDSATDEYFYVGGDPWHGARDFVEVGSDESVPTHLPAEQCQRFKCPSEDWFSLYPGPQQVVRNGAFLLGSRRPLTDAAIIRGILRTAIGIHQAPPLHRLTTGMRAGAAQSPSGKCLGGLEEGDYIFGVAGLRRWADTLDAMREPSHDSRYIHGHDISMGEQLQFVADAVRWLDWASRHASAEARPYLATAKQLFAQAEHRSAWGVARQCLVNFGDDCKTADDVRESRERASLVTIYPKELRPVLLEMGLSVGKCWLGLSVLPDQEHFDAAKREAVENIRAIADLREQACAEMALALERV